jgi:hypothetical protein
LRCGDYVKIGSGMIFVRNNGLEPASAAQCQRIHAVAVGRIEATRGNVGAAALVQIREVLGLILEVPG